MLMELSPDYRSFRSLMRTLWSLPHWHALRTHALDQLDWCESRRLGKSINAFGPVPWWSYSCTDFLDQLLPVGASVLELGGGASSQWWLRRGNRLTTVESDTSWSSQIFQSCYEWRDRHELFVNDLSDTESVAEILRGRRFDVAVNDGSGDRVAFAGVLAEHLSISGILVWDNSDRPDYQDGLDLLAQQGWSRLDFFGLGPINAYASRTSVFFRGSMNFQGREVLFRMVPY
jgi:hypothetical protein